MNTNHPPVGATSSFPTLSPTAGAPPFPHNSFHLLACQTENQLAARECPFLLLLFTKGHQASCAAKDIMKVEDTNASSQGGLQDPFL